MREANPKAVGFDDREESIEISAKLDNWQKAGDERMWKLIVSPEFADRVDLKRLTRDLMKQMTADLGEIPLEWVAAAHYNTDHPHVHIALRGVGRHGQSFQLSREYLKAGIRSIAENLCTNQLGYRTELEVAAAERREVCQQRYTSLDRVISRNVQASSNSDQDSQFFTFIEDPPGTGIRESLRLRQQHVSDRLFQLRKMDLAQSVGPRMWHVRRDFESVLRAMQRTSDVQKMLVAHGTPISDERLPMTILDCRNLTSLDGRILVHGEEEVGREAGRSYLILEGTDARVHHIYYTPEMEQARSRGGLKTNSFVSLRKLFVEGRPVLEIAELGDAETLLTKGCWLRETAKKLIKRGIIPEEDGWGGWLGRYQAALRKTSLEELDRKQRIRNQIQVERRGR